MKNKKYLIVSFLVLLIFSIIFVVKGIFPFGDNSIVWSDMHEQITAIYYHFYDAIRGNHSLLVDFTSGGGVNFLGIMAYYIMSPVSLILLCFPRVLVIDAVSIVVVLKTLLASITCLYFISKYFKKVKSSYQILLSLLYAFSSYTFLLYIITPWMDIVYLFPLLLIGLRKLLDLEDSKVYIIVLTLCLIFCFYISFILLLFVIFASLLYLYIYKKENLKHAIFDLGVSTVISLLLSSVVLVPTFIQVFTSQRAGFDLGVILNSRFGPLSDKLAFLFGSGIIIAFVCLLLLNFKKHKKFISLLFPLLILVGLPIVIEPINKLWHFGSYVYFPYRYGFILIFLLIIGASYYLNNVNNKVKVLDRFMSFLPTVSVIISICAMVLVLVKFRFPILEAVEQLTLTRDKKVLISLFLIFVLVFVSSIVLGLGNKNKKSTIVLVYILAFVNILFNGYFYLGGYDPDGKLSLQYDQMLSISNNKKFDDGYYLKEVNRDLISNYGMVTGVNTFSNFTSLTDKVNYYTMQRLGYDSYWMDTQSIGGNLFTDIVLGQKYIVSSNDFNDSYYKFIERDESLNYYEFIGDMPYGYILKNNASLESSNSSFEASNIIYNSITGNGDIFEIKTLVSGGDFVDYKKGGVIEESFDVVGTKRLYLDIFTGFDNVDKVNSYKSFDVYVNGELVYKNVPNDSRNGSLLLGSFEDCRVDIKIVSLKDVKLNNITLGALDLSKVDEFVKNNNVGAKVSFDNNIISVDVIAKEGDILFLPITYIDGYDSDYELFRVFDNFVGIKLKEGNNNIEITYVPKGMGLGIILTMIGVIFFILWIKLLYGMKLLILDNIFYYVYIFVYIVLIMVFYLLMPLAFIKSFLF